MFFLYSSEKNLLLFYTQPDFEFCAHCETVNGGRRVSYMYTCKKKKKKSSAYFTSQFMTYEANVKLYAMKMFVNLVWFVPFIGVITKML